MTTKVRKVWSSRSTTGLAGESGAKRVLKDRLGRSIENVESIRPPRHGKDLRTSIDLRLQYLAYRTLKAAIKTYQARSGSIVVLDVKTGEVLAMVNQPTYNPNDRSQFSPERYRNRAITDIFEPGSSIKPLVVAAALESGEYRPSSIVDTAPGYVTVGAKKIEDRRNLGRVSLTTILARSSQRRCDEARDDAAAGPAVGDDDAVRSRCADDQRLSRRVGGHADALQQLEARLARRRLPTDTASRLRRCSWHRPTRRWAMADACARYRWSHLISRARASRCIARHRSGGAPHA